jgi:hypothetical protein
MTSSPFLYLIMSTLGPGLSTEKAVIAYVGNYPDFHHAIRDLSTAVSEAGVRARDSGMLRGEFDDNLRVYSPMEIWMFDLAVDVIAMLGSVDGISNSELFRFRENVRTLDQEVSSHYWKSALREAGPGVPQFQQLRASVPRHVINPSRY